MKKTTIFNFVAAVTLLSGTASANAAYFMDDYTLTKDCGAFAVYAGPNMPSEHGGVCLGFSEGVFKLHTSYTNDKSCENGGAYVGPNRPDLHGGTCIWAQGYQLKSTYTTSRSCGLNATYVGPNRPDKHGGTCLSIVE
ncbi:hypothetical protein [Zooshikella sp. RANM57]|uniref:hypothetical protein n=1 Tax=Zooshikella sp. RANM57 TaxID=3425863 RepID=UPI003D6FDD7E